MFGGDGVAMFICIRWTYVSCKQHKIYLNCGEMQLWEELAVPYIMVESCVRAHRSVCKTFSLDISLVLMAS